MINPGHYSWCYPSAAVSPYYCWFQILGYPELDIYEENDGTWFIIQYLNSPLIPSLTKWQMVLGPMKNVEKSFGFCQKYIAKLDITKKAFWAREEAKTKQMLEEHEALDRHKEDVCAIAHNAITHNDELMNRIAKNGISEMDITKLARHVPKTELFKPAYRGVKVDVCNPSQPVHETMDERVPSKV